MALISVRNALRAGTAQAHRDIEQVLGTIETREQYARYLTGMYRFRAPLEMALRSAVFPEFFNTWRPLYVAPLMRQDMTDLHLAIPENATAYHLPEDEAGLLGLLYVVEGSSMGARLIYKSLSGAGIDEDFGARHLARLSAANQQWSQFASLLEQADRVGASRAIGVANQVFSYISACFSEPPECPISVTP